MENEERIPVKAKQAWQTPEIVDLDLDKTSGKAAMGGETSSATGPS